MEETDFLIHYGDVYSHLSSAWRPIFFIVIFLWIVTLFYLLFVIANRHFSWALERLSKIMRLSQDMAGMTLLAFGNGAPDFFTAVFGATQEPEMILGSSIGSGLFILSIVFGSVIIFAKKPGEGLLRLDEEGNMTSVSRRLCHTSTNNHTLNPIPFFRGVMVYIICVGFLICFSVIRTVPFWLPLILVILFALYLSVSIFFYILAKPGSENGNSLQSDIVQMKKESDKNLFSGEKRDSPYWHLPFHRQLVLAIYHTCWQDDWSSSKYVIILHALMALPVAIVKLPLNLTILPVELPEEAAKSELEYLSLRLLHRIRCVANPFFSIPLYISLLFPGHLQSVRWYVWVIYGCLSFVTAVGMAVTTSWHRKPKLFYVHLLQAFVTCIFWIYGASKELVSCLAATGDLLNISPTIMGILVLAWGNSFGDLVSDVVISKNGGFETAVAAVFSGPIQNVLLTIGTSFLIATLQSQNKAVPINLMRSDVHMSLGFLVLILLLIIVLVPFFFDFRIPSRFGMVLLSIYILYIPLELLCGLGVINLY